MCSFAVTTSIQQFARWKTVGGTSLSFHFYFEIGFAKAQKSIAPIILRDEVVWPLGLA